MRARPIVPGRLVVISRRCHEGRLFMAPGKNAEQIRNFYGYTLAVALERNGHAMHSASQLGNRHRVAVTDGIGDLPGFKNSLHGNLARGLNSKRERSDAFWGGDRSWDSSPPNEDEALTDLVFIDTALVEAGLVEHGDEWPGFTTYGWRFGETRTFRRPGWYYDPNNPDNPEFIELTRTRPKIMLDLTDDELFELLMDRCRKRVGALRERMHREGRRCPSAPKLAKERWNRAPSATDGGLASRPGTGSRDRFRERAKAQRDRGWERRYAKARDELLAGATPVFPYGTYYLRRHAGVRVANAPP